MNTLKTKLHTLIAAAVTPEVVILADQNSPRPPLPYWTVRLQVQRKIGTDSFSQGVETGVQEVRGVREGTLQLQRYGVDSELACASLRDTLAKTSVMEVWRVALVSLYDIGNVLNVPQLMAEDYLEPRAAIDLFIRFGTVLNDTVEQVETVEVTAAFETVDQTDGFDANPDLADVITVVL